MPGNVEVRPLDARDAEFGRDEFDLVHHRSVLSYVSSREQVLARLVGSLRPGGWLVSEEPDFEYRVVLGDSADRLLTRFFRALRQILAAKGTDFSFGPRLIVLFRDLGLVDIDPQVCSHVVHGGSLMSEVIWRAVEPLRSQLLNVAGFADEEVDRTVVLLRSRESFWVDPAVISVVGRRLAGRLIAPLISAATRGGYSDQASDRGGAEADPRSHGASRLRAEGGRLAGSAQLRR